MVKSTKQQEARNAFLQWQQNFQKEFNSDSYRNHVNTLNKAILKRLCGLANDNTTSQHMVQIRATLDHINWYDADSGIDRLLFQSYSLINHDEPNVNKTLHRISREYRYGMNVHNQSFKNLKSYEKEHGTLNGYNYVLALTDEMLSFLWEQALVRKLIAKWLLGYIKIKNLHGAESRSERNYGFHAQNKLIQSFLGYTSDNKMYLPSYKRNYKQVLTKEQWIASLKSQANTFSSLWD